MVKRDHTAFARQHSGLESRYLHQEIKIEDTTGTVRTHVVCLCLNCEEKFLKPKRFVTGKDFCCPGCCAQYKRKSYRVEITCDYCDKTFEKTKAKITNKNFCSRGCKDKYQWDPKYCLYCQTPVFRTKYCSNGRRCQTLYERQEYIRKWKIGEVSGGRDGSVSLHIRKYLFEMHGDKCQKCGWGETNPTSGRIPLTVNHIDGNSNNHKPGNLELLCPNCHSLTSTYGSLNLGKGRRKRAGAIRKYNKRVKKAST